MKNPNDPIGNRAGDLLACSAVPQYAIYKGVKKINNYIFKSAPNFSLRDCRHNEAKVTEDTAVG